MTVFESYIVEIPITIYIRKPNNYRFPISLYIKYSKEKNINKEGDIMFKDKKAFIAHPATWVIGAFILGLLVMYLIAKGTISVPLKVC